MQGTTMRSALPPFALLILVAGAPGKGLEERPQGPREVDPYLGVYEGTYERGGKLVKAEARVTTTGKHSPYQATVFVEPEVCGSPHFLVSAGGMFDDLDVYTSKDGSKKGVSFAYYEGNYPQLDFEEHEPVKTGTVPYFALDPRNRDRFFGFKFTGFVKLGSSGRHRFFTASDDTSRLAIDGKVIVDNQGHREKSGVVELEVGMHPVTVTYYQHVHLMDLKVGFLKISEEEERRIVLKGAGMGTEWQGRLLPDKLVLTAEDSSQGRFVLKYSDRQSPTLGLKPPEGAIVLLGRAGDRPPSLEEWTNQSWIPLPDGSMQVGKGNTLTTREFGDVEMHLEFMCPFEPEKLGQGRGNSGVYLQARYELQVLDSFGFEPRINTCGAVYYIEECLRPVTLPPLTWQTYDVIFRAARHSADGEVEKDPIFEVVRLNGRVVHENLPLPKKTYGGRGGNHPKTGPLMLQDHKNPVRYRNIWIKPMGDR